MYGKSLPWWLQDFVHNTYRGWRGPVVALPPHGSRLLTIVHLLNHTTTSPPHHIITTQTTHHLSSTIVLCPPLTISLDPSRTRWSWSTFCEIDQTSQPSAEFMCVMSSFCSGWHRHPQDRRKYASLLDWDVPVILHVKVDSWNQCAIG